MNAGLLIDNARRCSARQVRCGNNEEVISYARDDWRYHVDLHRHGVPGCPAISNETLSITSEDEFGFGMAKVTVLFAVKPKLHEARISLAPNEVTSDVWLCAKLLGASESASPITHKRT